MKFGTTYVEQAQWHRAQAKLCRGSSSAHLETYHWNQAGEFMGKARATIQYHHQMRGNTVAADRHARKMLLRNQRTVARILRQF